MVRVLIDGTQGAARNMAVDEALLRLCKEPMLRFYRWSEDGVSIGYFQSWKIAPKERSFVRRYTGGGMVDHARDFTYSIIAPKAHPICDEGIHASYQKIHEHIASALNDAGIDAILAQTSGVTPYADEPSCFKKPVKFDVILNGKKIAGGAQRRTREGCLHQGSILIENADFDSLVELFSPRLIKILGKNAKKSALMKEEDTLAFSLEQQRYATQDWNYSR
ncbi:MAG: lipoate--protein ligase family protein [Verrucomicrobiota bacterium]